MRLFVAMVSALAWLAAAEAANAQIIPPPQMGGPAQGAMQQLHPPTPLEQVREQSLKQSPALPLPPAASERWVPERQLFVPDLGRTLLVPGHYERRITDQQYAVPTLPALDVRTGATVIIPGGERPPADLRPGP
jgi:hypothetical protein